MTSGCSKPYPHLLIHTFRLSILLTDIPLQKSNGTVCFGEKERVNFIYDEIRDYKRKMSINQFMHAGNSGLMICIIFIK